ncbi:MAG: glycosyltransferase family 4 protein [Clostridiales bacterium]|nr:glycosyltransferase family 4 protein [Clostridiales bacterium]
MDKKLVILQVHNFYRLPGGEDTVIENERRLLESQGHRVVRYFRDNKELKDFSVFRKLLLPLTTIFNPKTYREVRRLIRAEHIDIVHVHNTLNLISPSVYYAALAEGVPVVQTVHNFRLLCPGATFYRDGHICEDCLTHGLGCAVKHSCYRGSKLQTLACVISTKIHRMTGIYGKLNYICLTEFNQEKLLKLKQIRPERVFVKPNFVEKSGNDPRFDGRKTQLLYVGRLEKIKGTDLLLKAWEQVCHQTDARLILCGSGPMEDWCREYIESRSLTDIELAGTVPHGEVLRRLEEARALILPTQVYEGFPVTIVEAFSRGTPVIGTNIGNTGRLVNDGVNGLLFAPGSSESLARALLNCLHTDMRGMGENAYRDYVTLYSEDVNYGILLDIYHRVLGE